MTARTALLIALMVFLHALDCSIIGWMYVVDRPHIIDFVAWLFCGYLCGTAIFLFASLVLRGDAPSEERKSSEE